MQDPVIMRDSLISQTIPDLYPIQDELTDVVAVMTEQVHSFPIDADVEPLLAYVETQRGKMIRPSLVLLSGRCFGPLVRDHVQVAAIMELIHTATLLHDDVIDTSEMRRGKGTVNHLWSNATAVLVGDFILSHVLRMCVRLDTPIAAVIADTVVRVCHGELLQTLDPAAGTQPDEIRYIDVIRDKSAHFFAGCCRAGAMLAGAPTDAVAALTTFGLEMGMAFQMADDLIDVCGSATEAGKPVGRDADSHFTLPVIHMIQSLGLEDRDEVEDLLGQRQALLDRLTETGSLDYVRSRCAEATQAAIDALQGIADSEAKEGLLYLARYAGNRSA